MALLLIISALFCFNTPIDIHLYDTYLVFPLSFIIWIPAVILFAFWIIYLLTRQFLFSKKLMWTNILLTVALSLFLMMLPYISTYSDVGIVGSPRRYYDYGEFNRFKILDNLTRIAVITFAILLLSQLAYFINLILGLLKRVSRENKR
jgi:heme/copper-type cytochrome/quinol oxidase subunit 1